MTSTIFYIFNGAGFLLSIVAIIVIVHTAMKTTGYIRKGLLRFFKGLLLVCFSFFWTLFFGQAVAPMGLLTFQSIFLSLGMAMLVYSANKLYEMHEGTKS